MAVVGQPVTYYQAWDFVVEIEQIPIAGFTKATGLERLCAQLGIDRSEVLAIGDSMNDIEMLKWAGVGVLMGHAGDEMRPYADVVTDPRPGYGVAAALDAITP